MSFEQIIIRLWNGLITGDREAILGTALGVVIAAVLGWLFRAVYRFIRNRLRDTAVLHKEISKLKDELKGMQSRLSQTERAVEGDGLWLARPEIPPTDYRLRLRDSIPILTVANLKGGVGKTTTAANIAAHFAEKDKQILAIDLDFQGSLSSLRNITEIVSADGVSAASLLTSGKLPPETLLALLGPVPGADNAKILPANYDLARTENAIMVHWLTQKEQRDVRYFLAETLLDERIQENFDAIILDSPPRLTTASIQALAASTHLLIPTVLDGLSVMAVQGFLDQIAINQKIWPELNVAGVVGTMTQNDIGKYVSEPYGRSHFRGAEPQAMIQLEESINAFQDSSALNLRENLILPHTCFVPRTFDIARASGEKLAYLDGNPHIKAMFARLGDEVADRIGLKLD